MVGLGGEKEKVEKSYSTLVGNGLSLPRSVLSSNFKKIEGWLKNTLSQTNQTKLGKVNKRYIASLGERAASQSLALYPVYTLPAQSESQTQDKSSSGEKQEERSLSFFLLKSLVSVQKPNLVLQKRKNNQPKKPDLVRTASTGSLPQNKENAKGKKTGDEKPASKKRGKSKE